MKKLFHQRIREGKRHLGVNRANSVDHSYIAGRDKENASPRTSGGRRRQPLAHDTAIDHRYTRSADKENFASKTPGKKGRPPIDHVNTCPLKVARLQNPPNAPASFDERSPFSPTLFKTVVSTDVGVVCDQLQAVVVTSEVRSPHVPAPPEATLSAVGAPLADQYLFVRNPSEELSSPLQVPEETIPTTLAPSKEQYSPVNASPEETLSIAFAPPEEQSSPGQAPPEETLPTAFAPSEEISTILPASEVPSAACLTSGSSESSLNVSNTLPQAPDHEDLLSENLKLKKVLEKNAQSGRCVESRKRPTWNCKATLRPENCYFGI